MAMFFGFIFWYDPCFKLSKQGVGSREAAASLSATLDPGTKVCWQIAGRKMSCCCTDWRGTARKESHDPTRRLRRE